MVESLNKGNAATNMKWNLSHITIVTTQKCNLLCKGCYVDTNMCSGLDISRLEDDILLPFVELGGKTIGFSGGEPLLYNELFAAIRMAKQHNILTSLVTNGVLLSREVAKSLKNLGLDSLQISLDSSDATYNDNIRGCGNKENVVNAIKNAVDVGLSPSLVAVPNISLLNNFETYIIEACRLKVGKVYIRRKIKNIATEQLIEEREFNKRFLCKIKEMIAKFPSIKIVSGDPLFNVLRFNGQYDNTIPLFSGCSAGITSLAIWPNGIITPCTRLSAQLGNVYREGLRQTWMESEPLLNLRKRNLHGECGQCELRYACGGCRASSFNETGDFLGGDPMCFRK